tara:strand:+ start:257 stop:481 length:225 start_codon:yes stop_codon:yes gene_type:complete
VVSKVISRAWVFRFGREADLVAEGSEGVVLAVAWVVAADSLAYSEEEEHSEVGGGVCNKEVGRLRALGQGGPAE